MKHKLIPYLLVLLAGFNCAVGQNIYPDPLYYKVFDKDSLKGFDEPAAKASALSEGSTGAEVIVKMYNLKREYIDNKYGLIKIKEYLPDLNPQQLRPTVYPGCLNEDFESSISGPITNANQINGWVLLKGYNAISFPTTGPQASVSAYYPNGNAGASSCNMTVFPLPTQHSSIIDCSASGGYIDAQIGSQYPIYSVFGTGSPNSAAASANPQLTDPLYGSKILRLNDNITGDYSIERVSKTFAVTANNSLFRYAFISVLSTQHPCCDASVFSIRLRNATTNSIICPSFFVPAPGSSCFGIPEFPFYYVSGSNITYTYNSSSANGALIYNKWQISSIDLAPYIGQALSIEFIASDCSQGGHFGYLYVDAQCDIMKLKMNTTEVLCTDSVLDFVCCDSLLTMQAPNHFFSYSWAGPAGITSTTSSLSTTVAGSYTLNLNHGYGCITTRVVHLSFSSHQGTITTSSGMLCEGYPSILSAIGLTNCVWSTGDTLQNIYVSPLVSTTYTVDGIDANGCLASASITQSVMNCTGLNKIAGENKIILFPNPNNGEFVLLTDKPLEGGVLTIESVSGQMVHKQEVYQGKNIIKTRALIQGLYYYTVTENKKPVSKGKLKIE